MELEQLVKLTRNLHDHFHLKGKTNLTGDEYRICESLLSHDIDLNALYKGLTIINSDIQFFGNLKISRGNQNA